MDYLYLQLHTCHLPKTSSVTATTEGIVSVGTQGTFGLLLFHTNICAHQNILLQESDSCKTKLRLDTWIKRIHSKVSI